MIYLQLFWNFLQIGLFSIGGGYAAMPLIQEKVVEEHGWLAMSEFTDLLTIAEMTPGPIAVNSATFVGIRIAGIGGAIVATLGSIFPSLFIVSFLAFVYYKYQSLHTLQSVLSSLRPAVVALIFSAGLSILIQVVFEDGILLPDSVNWIGIVLFAGAFFALRKFHLNSILVMALCGAAGVVLGLLTGS